MLPRIPHFFLVAFLFTGSDLFAQGTPTTAATPGGAALPKNIDNALTALVTIRADNQKLADVLATLRDLTQTNMAVNWNALGQSGLKRDTLIDLQLKDVTYEQVIKTILEILPVPADSPTQRANYTVGDNTLTLTTNAELGKGNVPRLADIAHGLSYTLEPSLTQATRDQNAQLLTQVWRAELIRAGEPFDNKAGSGHALAIREATLAATLSAHGQNVLDRAVGMINSPLRIGQLAAGTQLTPAARKAQDALKAISTGNPGILLALAKEPAKYRDKMNMAFLPGTAEEVAKAGAGEGGQANLAYAINDGGVVLIGPRESLRTRTVMAVYDLRDLIKRLNFKNTKKPQPSPADYQTAIVQIIQTNIKPTPAPETWGTLEDLTKSPPSPSCLIPYNGLLIVLATPETHRTLAAALQDMYK